MGVTQSVVQSLARNKHVNQSGCMINQSSDQYPPPHHPEDSAAVHSKAVVLLLFIVINRFHCLLVLCLVLVL